MGPLLGPLLKRSGVSHGDFGPKPLKKGVQNGLKNDPFFDPKKPKNVINRPWRGSGGVPKGPFLTPKKCPNPIKSAPLTLGFWSKKGYFDPFLDHFWGQKWVKNGVKIGSFWDPFLSRKPAVARHVPGQKWVRKWVKNGSDLDPQNGPKKGSK